MGYLFEAGEGESKLDLGDGEHVLGYKAPTWSDIIRAETLAKRLLRDVIEVENGPAGEYVEPSKYEKLMLNLETANRLAMICLRTVDGEKIPDHFWDRLKPLAAARISGLFLGMMRGEEVGLKN